jgi:mono/diheme cytochrome c family protein
MSKVARLLLGVFALGPTLALSACGGDFTGGYEKVAYRERAPLAMAAAPDPPPVVAGIGSAGPAAPPTLAPGSAPAGVTQEMVEEGQRLYGTVCTACHGPAAVGTPAGPSLNDQNWIHIGGTFDEIVAIIISGVPAPAQYPGMMPPLGGGNFTPEQVNAISAYIFALSQQPGA